MTHIAAGACASATTLIHSRRFAAEESPMRRMITAGQQRIRARVREVIAASPGGLHVHQIREQLPDLTAIQIQNAIVDLLTWSAIERAKYGVYIVPLPEPPRPLPDRGQPRERLMAGR
jgi:hypothetical protein